MQNIVDALISKGFTPTKPSGNNDKSWYFSKKQGKDTFYFVEVRFWDFTKYGADADGWDVEIHMSDHGWFSENADFRIIKSLRGIHINPTATINHILEWADSIFSRLDLSCFYKEND